MEHGQWRINYVLITFAHSGVEKGAAEKRMKKWMEKFSIELCGREWGRKQWP